MLKLTWTPLAITLMCALAHAQAPKTTTTVAKPAKPAVATVATATTTAPAQGAATSTTAPKKEEAPSVKFSFFFNPSYSIKAEPGTDGTRDESISYFFSPSMSYGVYRASVYTLYGQDIKDTKSSYWIDPVFTFSRSAIPLSDYFKLGPSVSITLPMTDGSKNNTELLYTIAGALNLSLNTKNLGLDKWSTSYYVAYDRNFTRYSTTAAGEPVTMQRIRQRINVGYSFTDKLSLSTRFQLDSNYSAEGIVRNKFLHFQTISYQINDTVALSAGHTNANNLLDGTTYQNNLKFYDETTSEYSAGIEISI